MYDKRRYAECVSYGSRRWWRHTRYELVPLWRHVLLWCTPIRTKLQTLSRQKLFNAHTRIIPRQQNGTTFVPLADVPITTQRVHQETTASSREHRKFHQQLFILLSCGIWWEDWAACVCLAWFRCLQKEPRSRTEPTLDGGTWKRLIW